MNNLGRKQIFVITAQAGYQLAEKVEMLLSNDGAYPVLFGVGSL
jgi:hypothetical protein